MGFILIHWRGGGGYAVIIIFKWFSFGENNWKIMGKRPFSRVATSSSNQGRVQLVARMRMIDLLYIKNIYVAHSCQRVELDLDSYYS